MFSRYAKQRAISINQTWISWTLQWRHNERNGVSNRRRLDCLLNSLFRRRSKKHQSPASQKVSNAENVSISWPWTLNCELFVSTWCGIIDDFIAMLQAYMYSDRISVRINGQHSEEFGVGVGGHRDTALVLEALLREFRTVVPWELLYAHRGYPAKRALSAMRKHGG